MTGLANLRLGVVGGGGWLGKAIVQCLLDSGTITPDRLYLSSRRPRAGLFPGATWTHDNQLLVDNSDIVLVSVRPGDFAAVEVDTQGKLVISVMAGVSFARIQAQLHSDRIIRALPNAAAEVARSHTPWVATPACTDNDRIAARTIFEACGKADELTQERQVDYLAAISGTGPAFPALLADALRRHAIAHDIPAEVARRAVNTLLVGTGRLVEAQDRCPADVVDEFIAYQGMLTAALETMKADGFDDIVGKGIEAALRRANTLS
ncbi:pyrroline-5-carboxylate reductase dimerization domain-containing protein [Paracoccus sp. APAP_BH8]|uniref:pyrroline-5-carboxylate reductase family protein n=1 Tax=Paracoccus TaxID=265 RepID=UPI000F42A212|nr:pyrroline-5-carboxylate reductase dimerization domain-containing protein [Paracoccus pantotrophus]RNI18251.1 pyrroline-5-carboxylate reductase [Paracoccus pantotrophus]